MRARSLIFALGLVGGICAIVGALGPWVTALGDEVQGTEARAGWTTLSGAALSVLLAAVALRISWLGLVAAIPAGIVGAVSGWYAADPDKFVEPFSGDIAWGLVLSAIGSIVLFVMCLLLTIVRPRQATTPPVA